MVKCITAELQINIFASPTEQRNSETETTREAELELTLSI